MILGGFGRCSIFGVFGTGKKSAKKPEKSDILVQITKFPGFWAGPAECAVPPER